MSTVEIVKTLITALQSGDLELAASTMSDSFQESGLTPSPLSRDEFLTVQSELLAAMPDFSYNLSNIQVEGDTVKALIAITGTHNNILSLPMFGLQTIEPTGLAVELPQVESTYRVVSGKVVEMRTPQVQGTGFSGLLQQVGAELPLLPRVAEVDERNITQQQ